jgi:hypothetical protein
MPAQLPADSSVLRWEALSRMSLTSGPGVAVIFSTPTISGEDDRLVPALAQCIGQAIEGINPLGEHQAAPSRHQGCDRVAGDLPHAGGVGHACALPGRMT